MKKTILTIAMALTTMSAQAATVDFEFAALFSPQVQPNIVNITNGGQTVVNSNAIYLGQPAIATLTVGAGLGVASSNGFNDSVNPGEAINVNFQNPDQTSKIINLTSMSFKDFNGSTNWDASDHAHYTVDGGAQQQVDFGNGTVLMNDTGSNFTFLLHDGQPLSSSFYISSMEFNDPQLSAVPLPAAVWLFGAGLIGLVGVARRKIS